nr:uncharacterized protein LOC126519682 [Dermacentor andersoni]
MDPGGHGRMAHDHNEDDGDPNTPGRERQPAREDGTLTVFFPVPHTVRCCEEGCRAAYAAAKWTARRQSLQRHLELEHGTRIRRTINVCSICGETLGLRPASHACLLAADSTAPPAALPHQCGSCSMSFPTRRGLSNHEQWHRREAALAARRDLAAGAASGASEQDNDGTPPPPTEQDSTEGPAEDLPETPAVATEKAADQEPSPVAPRGTPGQSSDGEMAEAPSQRTPTQSGRTAASATPSPTPSLLSNRGIPGAPASEAHEPAAMQELSPGRAESQDHDGSTQDFGTQEEHAGTMRPEGSAWGLEDETAELRVLSRLPESAGQWARFENILDRAIAAATKHLRLPVRDSRQSRRREVNPDNPQQIQTLYRRNRRRASHLWSPTTVDTSILRSRLPATEELDLCPFSPEEVAAKLRKCESTAPGEDRLTYHHWRQVDPEGRFLAAVYNLCLQYRRTPLSWKSARTILIHKKGDREDPTNWRPIALGRTIAKLYAGCLTTRLQRWLGDHAVLSRCQKGFLPHDAVFEHNFVLQGRLDDARTGGGEVCVGFLDFANAFGSVTIVEDLYRANTTCVVAAAGITEPITIGAGLRQGCPLSGLFFNLVVDPVIRAVQGGDRQHNILAYADDLTLLAADPTTLQSRLDRVTALSARLGLRLNAAKCRSLHLSGRHPVGTRPTSFTAGGDPIPALGDFEGHKFLGRPVGFRVLPDETTVDEAIHLGRKLLSSMLAPWQRLDAIKTFLYPALNFAMRVGLASKGEWQRLDEELRPLIRKTLYVPARASNEYLYGSTQAGSAGIPLAAELSDICRVDGAFKLLTSSDVEVRERAAGDLEGVEAYLSGETEDDFRQMSTQVQSVWTEARKASRRLSVAWELLEHGARINCREASVSVRNRHKLVKTIRALLSTERDRALHDKPNQGKAMVCVAADPANSHFMRSGRYTRFTDWRFVHRARLNLLPLNATRLWAPAADKRCRRCGYGEETLPHVLCHCMRQSRAMERHNTIVARIKKAASGRFTVIAENQVVVTTSLKPDLVLARGEEALILDVGCPFENRLQAFQDARKAKEEKYSPVQRHLLRRFQRMTVDAVVVGCLGIRGMIV